MSGKSYMVAVWVPPGTPYSTTHSQPKWFPTAYAQTVESVGEVYWATSREFPGTPLQLFEKVWAPSSGWLGAVTDGGSVVRPLSAVWRALTPEETRELVGTEP